MAGHLSGLMKTSRRDQSQTELNQGQESHQDGQGIGECKEQVPSVHETTLAFLAHPLNPV